ncbi:hypothetical protein GF312_18465 [Candidatus Poribacteria bacterium]|nr:hypothetical protein [Candidatus Poribacteria bacterium]
MRFRSLKCESLILSLAALFIFTFLVNAQEDGENLISIENGGSLVLSDGALPDWPDEDWNGAIDGDLESWSGTVTTFLVPEGEENPWAIFAFNNESTQVIGSVGFFMLPKAVIDDNCKTRCGKDFQVSVSATGTDENDFEVVLEDTLELDLNLPFEDQEWIEFEFDAVKAKYIKLDFLSNYGDATYVTLGEFAVYGGVLAVEPTAKVASTWGKIKCK